MLTPLVTPSEVLGRLGDVLGKDPADLGPRHAGIAAEAARVADAEVYGRLMARGYTAGQVASADGVTTAWASNLALYLALLQLGLVGELGLDWCKALDPRESLDKASTLLTIDGVLVVPAAPLAGGFAVAGGRIGGCVPARVLAADAFR